nr:hypothetical protein [Tanacetum cinerariifolium]
MSSSSSHVTVIYTSTYSDMPSWAIPLMEAYESDPKAPEAAPQSLEQVPLSHVLAPEYLEYLASSNDDIPAEDQSLPADASPNARLPGYITDFKPIEDDSEEDPYMDPTGLRKARKMVRPQPPLPTSIEALIAEYGYAPTPPLPSPSLLPRIPSPPLLLPLLNRRGINYGLMTALEEVKESVADMATRHRQENREAMYARQAWSQAMGCNRALQAKKMAPKKTPMSDVAIKALIAQGVADALVGYKAKRGSGNGHDSHNSGSGSRRTPHTTRVCTYKDLLNCQPLNNKGTEEVVGFW